ncbi:hypothetical protein LCGC14_0812180 [marine sediment metagenome]|uniref:Uncharacterized protein n=1 Tax=marine sediment metagenome TaxID=412755 RepID=A0A0F9PLC7_9ZZZZ
MNETYYAMHQEILALLHDLVFGGYGLMGDAQERLLAAWYEPYKRQIEEAVEVGIHLPPVLTTSPREVSK